MGVVVEIQYNRCSREGGPKDNYDPVPVLETLPINLVDGVDKLTNNYSGVWHTQSEQDS